MEKRGKVFQDCCRNHWVQQQACPESVRRPRTSVQAYKRNELRSLYKFRVQEEPLSEIGSLIQDCIALTEADPAEGGRIEVHRSLFQPGLYTTEIALGSNRPSAALEDPSSSVLSESASVRSISRPGRRNSRDQDSDSFKRLVEELGKHNRLMEEFLRRYNPVSD